MKNQSLTDGFRDKNERGFPSLADPGISGAEWWDTRIRVGREDTLLRRQGRFSAHKARSVCMRVIASLFGTRRTPRLQRCDVCSCSACGP